ncbi:MAG: HEAT repeat domain-containing protein [Planctomycetes bacterium]|nr:HEAT repeat domain-containing protein [Planctomycetota bacterium]
MRRLYRTKAAVGLLVVGLVALGGGFAPAAEEDENEPLIQMILELVGDTDQDMRALGLQQIREEAPGEGATKRFAALLTDLPADGQAELLEALGDRQDATARPAVLEMLESKEEAVRAAAIRALGGLGDEADVALLAKNTTAVAERAAARESLVRLRGKGVDAAIVAAMGDGEPGVRAELLGVLARRNARGSLPTVLKSAEDPESSVRMAALGALRFLADESHAAAIVKILKGVDDDGERSKAELALLSVCSRNGEACAEAVIAGMADADVPGRIALLHGLGRAGGAASLEAILGRLEDDDESVRDEAVRMLSSSSDPAVVPRLLEIAKTTQSLRHQVLAIRGLVRLSGPQGEEPAKMDTLAEVMGLAKRPEEKRLVVGMLGGIATPESLALATSALDDETLAAEAALASVMIGEKIEGEADKVRAAMEKVGKVAMDEQVRQRAQQVLKSL